MARYKPGSVVRLSAKTYVLDLNPKVKEYLKSIGHNRCNIGDAEVWVRYSDEKALTGRRGGTCYPAEVGPTRESVEKKP